MSASDLFRKYDIPAPRYTSYPTVPYWDDSPTLEQWLQSWQEGLKNPTGLGMYLHLPFCETLCSFCGCNTVITRSHSQESVYIDALLKELTLYAENIPGLSKEPLKELHLGGGTPTFFAPKALDTLLGTIHTTLRISPDLQGSVEVDPRRTTREHLEVMREHGVRRISLGVQDTNPKVQRAVNRIQPFELVQKVTNWSRELGCPSVNFDLIYGLPYQTPESILDTVKTVLTLRPERVAFYAFALVPWIKAAHKKMEAHIPAGAAKRELYELGRQAFLEAGYLEIGMDHFAVPEDSLSQAMRSKSLHRGFMGYTDRSTDLLLGLGVSSIGETPGCYHQNEKTLAEYLAKVQAGQFPTLRGHRLSADDREHRRQILELMTRFETKLPDADERKELEPLLAPLVADGLILLGTETVQVTDQGRPFLRNICMAFDRRLRKKQPDFRLFSQAI